MLELPESHTIAQQLQQAVLGRRVQKVQANASPHKFAFYNGDPADYPFLLEGRSITGARAYGGLVEIALEEMILILGDGANPRLIPAGGKRPLKHQLLLELDDGALITCSVQMYGGIYACPAGKDDNFYHEAARSKPSPFTDAFDKAYFEGIVRQAKPNLSAKALLATEQRIPGLGNGVLQDILFRAGVHPRQKLQDITSGGLDNLYASVRECLMVMKEKGGRNTEKDLFGCPGGYQTILCSKTAMYPCPVCGSGIVKQAYLGGSVYFCPHCQPLRAE